jgi:hypothetical protein
MKQKIIWIEDSAFIDVQNLAGPVYVSGKYDIVVALDASEAVRKLIQIEFDAVVVDIRIPPGDNSRWTELYTRYGENKVTARLGLHILYSLFAPEDKKAEIKLENIPKWITHNRFGILTVESERELQDDLKRLNIQVFRQKTAEMSETALLEVIEEILSKSKSEI